ncbi:MAG: DUF2950 family protein, partial [Phyllobacterium sp.]|uniref:DUF2950 family protein n=1 Tax=Phyllobacterium sp. TaxID=1871046 RepID=UPI0030F0F208
MNSKLKLSSLFLAMALSLSVASPCIAQDADGLAAFAAGVPPSFDSPPLAVQRLKDVLAANDVDGLANLLGLNASKLKASNEAMVAYGLIRDGAGRRVTLQELKGMQIVEIGDRLWPLPFPITQGKDGKWAFNTEVGLQEIINRRVGENELATIQTMHDYANAQHESAQEDRDGDGVYEFAQKLISSEGKRDGLYWAPGADGEASPAAALIESAAFGKAKKGSGYYGYRYRILTGQGANVVGGKQSYIVNGNMTGGFALIAWPVKYGVTGVQTFIIND